MKDESLVMFRFEAVVHNELYWNNVKLYVLHGVCDRQKPFLKVLIVGIIHNL